MKKRKTAIAGLPLPYRAVESNGWSGYAAGLWSWAAPRPFDGLVASGAGTASGFESSIVNSPRYQRRRIPVTEDEERFWRDWKGHLVIFENTLNVIEFDRKRALRHST